MISVGDNEGVERRRAAGGGAIVGQALGARDYGSLQTATTNDLEASKAMPVGTSGRGLVDVMLVNPSSSVDW